MKIKVLLPIMAFAVFTSGCLKDSSQPVTHINDVNISLTGTWTQIGGIITYYDATGKKLYSSGVPVVNLQFDGNASVIETPKAGGSPVTENYSLSTVGNTDYITIANTPASDQFAITSLQSRNLALSETLNYIGGANLTVGGKTITYFSTTQVNTYVKENLPMN